MASVLHKELEYEVEKLKYTYKKLEVIQPRFKKKIPTSSWWLSHPGSAHKKFYRRYWLKYSLSFISKE